MVLSDLSIAESIQLGHIAISPFNPDHIQPSSYDVTLMGTEPVIITPLKLYLMSTVEYFMIPNDIQGQLHGRSSLGRLGTLIHVTAGLLDPGFRGQITLEVIALTQEVELRPGDRIGQVSFHQLDRPCAKPYNGRYQGQIGPTPSRFEHGDS